jgi:biotin transport system permease protein/energy-coupling factor transport system permease protein
MLVSAISVMFLPLYAACAGIVLLMISACLCGFTAGEQFTNIKPVLFYAFFLYMIGVLTSLFSVFSSGLKPEYITEIFYVNYEYGLYIIRLFLIMQLSALLFCTTTSIEIKETICAVEIYIRTLMQKLPFAKNISQKAKFGTAAALMINFIPALFELWNNLDRSYRARDGKKGLKKIKILFIALIALSFHYANRKAKALVARELV